MATGFGRNGHHQALSLDKLVRIFVKLCGIQFTFKLTFDSGDCGIAVVKVLCSWFDPSWCQWDFLLT